MKIDTCYEGVPEIVILLHEEGTQFIYPFDSYGDCAVLICYNDVCLAIKCDIGNTVPYKLLDECNQYAFKQE